MKYKMGKAMCVAVSAAFALAWGCVEQDPEMVRGERAITFGTPDGDEHPAVGAFMQGWYYGYPTCSGTLVYRDGAMGLFLTAGHCIQSVQAKIDSGNMTLDDFWVSFAEAPPLSPPPPFVRGPEDIEIIAMFDHVVSPASTIEVSEDFGILVLRAQPGQSLPEPVPIASEGYLDEFEPKELLSSSWLLVGYGGSIDFPPPEVYYTDRRQQASPHYLGQVNALVNLQQNPRAGNSGACIGDSGAPLFRVDPSSGEEILVAVLVGGPANCHSHSLAYRVDGSFHHAFLGNIIDGL